MTVFLKISSSDGRRSFGVSMRLAWSKLDSAARATTAALAARRAHARGHERRRTATDFTRAGAQQANGEVVVGRELLQLSQRLVVFPGARAQRSNMAQRSEDNPQYRNVL